MEGDLTATQLTAGGSWGLGVGGRVGAGPGGRRTPSRCEWN